MRFCRNSLNLGHIAYKLLFFRLVAVLAPPTLEAFSRALFGASEIDNAHSCQKFFGENINDLIKSYRFVVKRTLFYRQ